MEIELSKEQEKVSNNLIDWYNEVNRQSAKLYTTVGGFAGTGKTTLITEFKKRIKSQVRRIAYCAFTGKASFVLRTKLLEAGVYDPDDQNIFVGTIHKLIYVPVYGKEPKTGKKVIIEWRRQEFLNYELIIVDEASMVHKYMWDDLLSYGIPIIAVGDHGQLPPVGEESDSFLMKKPDFLLNTIHRQALDNPIIKLSVDVRYNGKILHGKYSNSVLKLDWKFPDCQRIFNNINFDENVMCLCGFNVTRAKLNDIIRKKKNFIRPEPYPGERLICLKNNYDTKVMNGQMGTLVWFSHFNDEMYWLDIQMDNCEDLYSSVVHNYCFGKENYNDAYEKVTSRSSRGKLKGSKKNSADLFDFGYAISVHKSQGSEWDKVVLFEQRTKYWEDEYFIRWLYTGVTRAKQKLLVITSFY